MGSAPGIALARRAMTSLHQYGCVRIGARAVLITGASGVGKTSLAAALIDRGATLVGDDGVQLAARDGLLFASPAPATRGMLELRGVGIITLPVADNVAVALLLRLSPGAPRYIETAPREDICGVPIPTVSLWPDSPVLALRAEWALKLHGIV